MILGVGGGGRVGGGVSPFFYLWWGVGCWLVVFCLGLGGFLGLWFVSSVGVGGVGVCGNPYDSQMASSCAFFALM